MKQLRNASFPVLLLLILVVTLALFRLPVVDSLKLLFAGSFGDQYGWSRTAVKSTPLLLTGLGMVVAWRGGMYNIGGEGQFIVGGLCGAAVAKWCVFSAHPLPVGLGTALILTACVLGGAGYAWLAGWLYIRRGVEVVISTILLNFIALQVLGYACSGPLQEVKKQVPLSDALPDTWMLHKLNRQMDVHSGVFMALGVALAVYVLLFRTKLGYKIRLVGENARMARANRLDVDRSRLTAIVLSGALCGFAGGIEYMGMAGQVGAGFSQQWGFLGIPVALLGGLHPLICLGSATVFGALFAGSENLARFTQAGATLVYVIQAVTVLGYVGIKAVSDRRVVQEAG